MHGMLGNIWDIERILGLVWDFKRLGDVRNIGRCMVYWAFYHGLATFEKLTFVYIHIAHISTFMIKVCVWYIGYVLLFIFALLLCLQYNHIFLWDIVLILSNQKMSYKYFDFDNF